MTSETIDIIKTGRGLAGSRVALIFAPSNAKPGSLIALTDFLNEQPGMRAIPGYHGPNQNHVLRISGLSDDASFLRLLQQEFPRWQKQNSEAYEAAERGVEAYFSEWRHREAKANAAAGRAIDEHFAKWRNNDQEGTAPGPVRIAEDIRCEPLEQVEHFPHQSFFKRFIKENANTLTGLSYMAGSLALMLAAWRSPRSMPGQPKHDWFRAYSALSYFAAAGILVGLSQKTDNPRDVYTIMESVYPPLAKRTPEERLDGEHQTNQVMQFLRAHPWEISMLLNSSGAASHAVSSAKRGRYTELTAALATLTATSLSAMIPEKGGRSLIPFGEWMQDEEGRGVLKRLEDFADAHPSSFWARQAASWIDWMQENPLQIASAVQGAANVGYASSGIIQKNPALTTMAAAYGTGNYTQSLATKGRGDGFDSVVTAAATIISADPTLANTSQEEIDQRIERLVRRLAEQREVVHPRDRLQIGIRERLERYRMDKSNESKATLTGFLPSEKHIIKQSPFVRPSHVQRHVTGEDKTATTQQVGI